MLKTAFLLPVVFLSACATIVNGSSQTVTVSTAPPGATCTVDRMGARVGAVAQTPGSLRLDKSKNDLSVTCSKPGFQTATVTKAPSFGGATFGNIIAGGVIGVVVDAASGANYEYPSDIRLDLAAELAPPLAQAPLMQAPVAQSLPVQASPRQASARTAPMRAYPVQEVPVQAFVADTSYAPVSEVPVAAPPPAGSPVRTHAAAY